MSESPSQYEKKSQRINPDLYLKDGVTTARGNLLPLGEDLNMQLRDRLAKEGNFAFVGSFSKEGLAVATEKRKWHITNGSEDIIIDKWSEYLCLREKGYYIKDTSLGHGESYYIDTQGNKILGPYSEAGKFSEGLAVVRKENLFARGMCMYIDKDGNRVFEDEYKYADSFWGGIASVELDSGKRYLINKQGENIGNAIFDGASVIMQGLGWTVKDGNQVFYNKEGKEVPCTELYELGFYSMAAYFDFSKAQKLAEQGFKIDSVQVFEQGVAYIENARDGKYYLVNDQYEIVSQIPYDQIYPFKQSPVSFAREGEMWWLIDTSGKRLKEFSQIEPFHDGVARVSSSKNPGDRFYIDYQENRVFS